MVQGHYHEFCRLHRLSSLPASEIQLTGFITYLADLVKAAPTTIQVYTAAVWSLHVEHGDNDPFSGTVLPPGIHWRQTQYRHGRKARPPTHYATISPWDRE